MPASHDHSDTHTTAPLLDPSHELSGNSSSSGNHGDKQGGSWIRVVVICCILAAAVSFVVWRIRTNKSSSQKESMRAAAMADRPVPVATITAAVENTPIYLTALGTVTAYNTVTVKSRVDGQIVQINFVEGQHVKQGDLLIRIDPRPYQATLDQAVGNLARDEANAKFAEAQSSRYSALYNAGVVSRESAQTQQSTAGQATGTLEADRAAIASARVNLAYTRITSPITGIVGLRQVDIGNVIAANSSSGLVILTQVQPIAVIFTIPEDQLQDVMDHLHGGNKLTVEAWDRANTHKIATGTLLTIDNQIDTTTGTAKLKAIFQNENEDLFPNQFVNARLILENRNALTIPAAAIQTASNGLNFVYVVDTSKQASTEILAPGGGKLPASAASSKDQHSSANKAPTYQVHAVPVKIALTQGDSVLIASGLKAGDVVVTDGQEKLQDGSKVNLRNAALDTPSSVPSSGTTRKKKNQSASSGTGSQGASQQ